MSKPGQNYRVLRYDEKCLIVKHLLETEVTISAVAKEYGVGETTIRDWLNRIDCNLSNVERLRRKPSSLVDRRRAVISELPDYVKEEIKTLLVRNPTMGALKLKQHFYRHHQLVLSEKKIYFYLKENGILASRPIKKDKETKCDRRFEYPYALAAVQVDLLTIRLKNKERIYLVTFLDDYSRYILLSKFVKEKTMESVIRLLLETIKLHGVMDTVICDKGSEFVSWQSFTLFEETLCGLDIELISSGPDTPQNQGKIERWHQSYRRECERLQGGFDSYFHAQHETDRYVNYYNYERVHQGIGGLFPADRYYGISEDIERELSQYHRANHMDKCIYFSCNINGKRLVVSGPRNGALSIYQNIKEESNG